MASNENHPPSPRVLVSYQYCVSIQPKRAALSTRRLPYHDRLHSKCYCSYIITISGGGDDDWIVGSKYCRRQTERLDRSGGIRIRRRRRSHRAGHLRIYLEVNIRKYSILLEVTRLIPLSAVTIMFPQVRIQVGIRTRVTRSHCAQSVPGLAECCEPYDSLVARYHHCL